MGTIHKYCNFEKKKNKEFRNILSLLERFIEVHLSVGYQGHAWGHGYYIDFKYLGILNFYLCFMKYLSYDDNTNSFYNTFLIHRI